jgi:hypothetical protein
MKEGKTYAARNFRVADNDYQYKMSEHKFKLTFLGATKVEELQIPDMPAATFKFKDYAEIIKGNYRKDLLVGIISLYYVIPLICYITYCKYFKCLTLLNVLCLLDAIGVVVEIGKCVTGSVSRKANAAFTMMDLSANTLDCTLWDALSVQFLDAYNNRNETGPFVIILKHARIKDAQGK